MYCYVTASFSFVSSRLCPSPPSLSSSDRPQKGQVLKALCSHCVWWLFPLSRVLPVPFPSISFHSESFVWNASHSHSLRGPCVTTEISGVCACQSAARARVTKRVWRPWECSRLATDTYTGLCQHQHWNEANWRNPLPHLQTILKWSRFNVGSFPMSTIWTLQSQRTDCVTASPALFYFVYFCIFYTDDRATDWARLQHSSWIEEGRNEWINKDRLAEIEREGIGHRPLRIVTVTVT